ncbi:DAK1/DegV-like protein [Dissoconium aciculare CBS 342.82]|uniref:DAK1/DegV-like protein n=1 Tax=Dissoconium aciculare CBS 342.82 TaxID=1314786 RepID=A0A6J3MJA6_9PEZI|nr:DAK1/DegV-like protein [Dissoconium aciculare CBS 342.82]KAF1827012.1 DAK1/DegV-like protein [Dissoconium aciculare CBS 342.82]
MNYTGDVLNFGVAVEKARAAGRAVEMVVVGDDVGVGRAQGGKVGRRGIAGTVLVLKIAGALADRGAGLEEVRRVAQMAAGNTVSIGASLGHVHVPGRGPAEEDGGGLRAGEVEIGMGIHNEAGSERTQADLPGVVKTMLTYMLDAESEDRGFIRVGSEDEVVLLINNLGGVSVLELGGIATEAITQLRRDYGIRPARILAGTYMTSLNGLGFSLTLLKTAELGAKYTMLELLDAPVEVTGWSSGISSKAWSSPPNQTEEIRPQETDRNEPCGLDLDAQLTSEALDQALERVIQAEPDITRFDTVVGDGDCGVGLKRGAEAIRAELAQISKQSDAALFLDRVTAVVERTMDGTSGALYAIFLNAVSTGLRRQHAGDKSTEINAAAWAKALVFALESLSHYTPAKPGDRTLMDALQPFVDELHRSGDVQLAAQAAAEGSQATKGMKASLGRTVYVGGSGFEEVPDPGAHGLAQFFQGLAEGLK